MTKSAILDQMLARAINEACFIIQEAICQRPQDMDLAVVRGTGFPAYRGGILRHTGHVGINNVWKKVAGLAHLNRFEPAPLLRLMAERNIEFYRDSDQLPQIAEEAIL